jgi:flagellar basal body-associated protein FliL
MPFDKKKKGKLILFCILLVTIVMHLTGIGTVQQ